MKRSISSSSSSSHVEMSGRKVKVRLQLRRTLRINAMAFRVDAIYALSNVFIEHSTSKTRKPNLHAKDNYGLIWELRMKFLVLLACIIIFLHTKYLYEKLQKTDPEPHSKTLSRFLTKLIHLDIYCYLNLIICNQYDTVFNHIKNIATLF